MKTGYVIPVILLLFSLVASGQQDPDAKRILDEFTKKAQESYPVKIGFLITSESLMDQSTWSSEGELILDGAKYYLQLEDSKIYCDGTTLWHYLIPAEEVYISDPENAGSDEDLIFERPQDLFTFYDRDFKYRYTGEVEYEGKKFHHIDLFPKDLNKQYHTITLIIGEEDYQLYRVQTKSKQGLLQTIQINNYQKKIKTTKDTFRFDASQHPEVEEIDIRL